MTNYFIKLLLLLGATHLLFACTDPVPPTKLAIDAHEHPLFIYFEKIEGNDPFYLKKKRLEDKGMLIPDSLMNHYNLYKFDMNLEWEKTYKDSSWVSTKGLYRWKHKGKHILLYTVDLKTSKSYTFGRSIYISVLDSLAIKSNIFLGGHAIADESNIVDCTIYFRSQGLALLLEEDSDLLGVKLPYHQILDFKTDGSIKISKGQLKSFVELAKIDEPASFKESLKAQNPIKLNLMQRKFVSSDESKLTIDLCQFSQLQWLSLYRWNLDAFPPNLVCLQDLQELNLGTNPYIDFEATFDILAAYDYLQKLNLTTNSLTSIPNNIEKLKSLQFLDLSNNKLKTLPDNIQKLKGLQELDLIDNDFNKKEQARIRQMLPNVEVYFSYEDME